MAGKRVLITGGIKGVGRAAVELFLNQGANVVPSARKVTADMADGQCVSVDFMNKDGCEFLMAEAKRLLGTGDILIHILGGSSAPGGGFAALSETVPTA